MPVTSEWDLPTDSDPRVTIFADVRDMRDTQIRTIAVLESMREKLEIIEHRLLGDDDKAGLCGIVTRHNLQLKLLWGFLISALTATIAIFCSKIFS